MTEHQRQYMNDRELPDWATVGAKVATLRSDWRTIKAAPSLTKIVKIGKRDIVLENGERFNRTLRRSQGGVWGRTYALLPVDAPEVSEAANAARLAHLRNRAIATADDYRLGRVTAFDVILAFAPLTRVADEIRALDRQ